MRSRTATALVGIFASLAVSVLAWWFLETLLFFLFVPFVPFLFRRSREQPPVHEEPSVRECPRCGFRTRDEAYEYCPRDGTRLEEYRGE